MKGREKGLLDDESEALLIIDGFVDGIRQLYQFVLVYNKILIRNLRLNHPVNHHVGSLQNGKEGVLYVFLSDRALDRRMLRVKPASGGYEALDSVHNAFVRYQAQRRVDMLFSKDGRIEALLLSLLNAFICVVDFTNNHFHPITGSGQIPACSATQKRAENGTLTNNAKTN